MSESNETTQVETTQVETKQIETKYDYKSPEHKPPFNTDYCEMNVSSFSDEVMCLTIGKNGKNFNEITEKNQIAYIYHIKDRNVIAIWGNKHKFNKVKNDIQKYIDWSTNYINTRD